MLEAPVCGTVALLMDFRPAGETFDRLFLATERHQYCVLGFDTEKCCLVTHAKGDLRDKVVG
jgi:DNA damage-binding protein 1